MYPLRYFSVNFCSPFKVKNALGVFRGTLPIDIHNLLTGSNLNFFAPGISRFQKDWLEFIKKPLINYIKGDQFEKYVVLFSRPISQYLPYKKKKAALEDIKKIVIEGLKLNLVIKCHPKDSNLKIYKEVFGSLDLDKKYFISYQHPYELADKAEFVITFFSSLVIDMAFLNIPTIEYLNLKNIPEFDNSHSLRDENGLPILIYRYQKLVKGVNNIHELKETVNKILKNKKQKMQDEKLILSKIIGNNKNPLDEICKIICQKL